MIPMLILVSFVCFVVLYLPPGDYLTTYQRALITTEGMNREEALELVANLREQYNLDQPFLTQYLTWVRNIVLRGDFGPSFQYGKPVGEVIWPRLGATFAIALTSLLFTWLVAIPIGIYSATHKYQISDYFFTFMAFIGLSVPNFFLALVLMYVMVFVFNSSAIGGLFSPEYVVADWSWAKVVDLLKHVWIAVIVVGMGSTAGIMRIMRSNLLDVLNMQYVQTARAKGVKERVVIYKHAVRNAIQPLVMTLGMSFPMLLEGSMVTSIVLNLPTTGPMFYQALMAQDMYLAGTFLMMLAFMLLLGNLFADLLLAKVDPRIRYE